MSEDLLPRSVPNHTSTAESSNEIDVASAGSLSTQSPRDGDTSNASQAEPQLEVTPPSANNEEIGMHRNGNTGNASQADPQPEVTPPSTDNTPPRVNIPARRNPRNVATIPVLDMEITEEDDWRVDSLARMSYSNGGGDCLHNGANSLVILATYILRDSFPQ